MNLTRSCVQSLRGSSGKLQSHPHSAILMLSTEQVGVYRDQCSSTSCFAIILSMLLDFSGIIPAAIDVYSSVQGGFPVALPFFSFSCMCVGEHTDPRTGPSKYKTNMDWNNLLFSL